ncbi:MAG TPA: c-type cytochrome [Candidatus Dormibacteraeota bacterium]|nr:c-type cytochrome [Candidatus Dormibacteraeota bacterium]
MSKFFFASCAALMAVLAVVFYLDYNKEWKPYELAYYQRFYTSQGKPEPVEEVKQLQPKNANEVERCITCHVPDIATLGGTIAAQRIPLIVPVDKRNPQAHPDRITDAMVKTYGLPSQYAGQQIDATGCMICHNGQGLATDVVGAHRNLIVNIFDVVDRGSVIFKTNCAACHGQNGEGGIGPPLNDQHRLGFFNDDYYYDCVYYGALSEHHLKSKMPTWGYAHYVNGKLVPAGFGTDTATVNAKVSLMVHWVRHYQAPLTFKAGQ